MGTDGLINDQRLTCAHIRCHDAFDDEQDRIPPFEAGQFQSVAVGAKVMLTRLDQHGYDIEPFIATFRVQVARERTRTWRRPAEGVDLRDQ